MAYGTMMARRASRRANAYAWIGIAVCIGLVIVLAMGAVGVGGLGLFDIGTAMIMIGSAIAVLSVGLVVALFSTRSALRALESYSEAMVMEVGRHTDSLAKTHQHAIDELATFGARQATAVAALDQDDKRHEEALKKLAGREERLEHRLNEEESHREKGIQDLRGEAAALETRIENDERAQTNVRTTLEANENRLEQSLVAAREGAARKIEHLKEEESELKQRVARDETNTRKVLAELERERASLQRSVRNVLAEERERKEEFEALAGEEIRLLGRVRRNEVVLRSGPRQADMMRAEYYRISRPKGSTKGPFGDVYPVAEVEGVSKARADRLRELGIANTEDLWRANPTFVSAMLHVERREVEQWQEEAELMAIRGIGRKYAGILVASGVTSIEKLGAESPEHLAKRAAKAGEDGLTPHTAENWIEAAQHHHGGR